MAQAGRAHAVDRNRRRGVFEALPRLMYRRTGARYFDACAAGMVGHGIAVAAFGVAALLLYVDLDTRELGLLVAISVALSVTEGVAAGAYLRRSAAPVRAWLAGERRDDAALEAWTTAARLPVMLLRRPSLYVIGAAGTLAGDFALAGLLDRPALEALLLFPASLLLYVSSVVLRYLAVELAMRPILEAIGDSRPEASPPALEWVSLHRRLLASVPMVTWGGGLLVAGLLTDDARDLNTIGWAGIVAFAVSAALSVWLSLVLADAVSGPIVDLRDATRKVAAGDLSVRVPVVCTDETGELAASFNTMVTGLGERERLREAFGTFVDPALAERVLAEGIDLEGEEIDVSVLFLDVRGFTQFAERAAAHEVVAGLNELYEAVVPVIARHGGHANKFIGDGLLAVFGAPDRHADHAARAVAAAREIAQQVRDGRTGDLRVGVGVNSGRVVVGTVGGGDRRDFTVIGDTVNTASRVEAATRQTGDDVLITEATLSALGADGDDFEERAPLPLRGKATSVRLYGPRRDDQG